MGKPTRITCSLLPEEVDAVMFAVRFYIDTVNRAHDGEDTSVWWEKRLRLFEDIEIDMGIRVKGTSGRGLYSLSCELNTEED